MQKFLKWEFGGIIHGLGISLGGDSYFNGRQRRLFLLYQILLPISPSMNGNDFWIWFHQNSLAYKSKLGYDILVSSPFCSEQVDENIATATSLLWKAIAPLKIKSFGWLVLHDKILTRSSLLKRVIINLNACLCPFCNQIPESVDHIFLSCSFAAQIWSSICVWLQLVSLPYVSMLDLMGAMRNLGGRKGKKNPGLAIWLGVIWFIWRARNALVFSNTTGDLLQIMDSVKVHTWEWVKGEFLFFGLSFWMWRSNPIACFSSF
jgi:hypothetical protein